MLAAWLHVPVMFAMVIPAVGFCDQPTMSARVPSWMVLLVTLILLNCGTPARPGTGLESALPWLSVNRTMKLPSESIPCASMLRINAPRPMGALNLIAASACGPQVMFLMVTPSMPPDISLPRVTQPKLLVIEEFEIVISPEGFPIVAPSCPRPDLIPLAYSPVLIVSCSITLVSDESGSIPSD